MFYHLIVKLSNNFPSTEIKINLFKWKFMKNKKPTNYFSKNIIFLFILYNY